LDCLLDTDGENLNSDAKEGRNARNCFCPIYETKQEYTRRRQILKEQNIHRLGHTQKRWQGWLKLWLFLN